MRRGISWPCLSHKTLEMGTKVRYHLLQEGFPDSTYAPFWLGCLLYVLSSHHIHSPGNRELNICFTVPSLPPPLLNLHSWGPLKTEGPHLTLLWIRSTRHPPRFWCSLNGDGSVNRKMIILVFSKQKLLCSPPYVKFKNR